MADEEIVTEAVPEIVPEATRDLSLDEAFSPVIDKMGTQAAGVVDLGEATYAPQAQAVQDSETIASTDYGLAPSLNVAGTTTQRSTNVIAPTGVTSAVDIESISRNLDNMPTNVQGANISLSTGAVIDPATIVDERTKDELLHEGTLLEARTQELALQATTQFQLESLYESLEEGKPLPGWASKNVRKVQDIMNSRGLGASSVAAAAMVQAISESALPIAIQDANKYAAIQLQNLNNQQQTALSNAATIASLDKQNLDNRMKAAQLNATSFLQMDFKNADYEQQVNTINYEANKQALFTDSAANNAKIQINAKTANDVNKFYDQLGVQTATANANRQDAMDQFDVDQANSIQKYNAKMNDERDKFNANMSVQIDQSNALWRRTINTANTAEANAANKVNSAAILGISNASLNALWQQYRDEASFAFTATENNAARDQQLALTVLSNQFAEEMFEAQIDAEEEKELSIFLGSLLSDTFRAVSGSLAKTLIG
tara:strand:+ start:1409 stop:2878 length:1470 start_codon:yes stop_codon:yes gene_type:complete